PPASGLSSTIVTDAFVEAAAAAASPAGPAPTIRMSVETLFTRYDLHSIADQDLAAQFVTDAVDRYTALKTNAHTTERPARLARHRCAKRLTARFENGGSNGRAFGRFDLSAVNSELYQCVVIFRDGRYGSIGMAGSRPTIRLVINAAVPSAVVMPRPSCPAAMYVFFCVGDWPIYGKLSRVDGRDPVHIRSADNS